MDDKKTVEIEIRDKKFVIDFVSNWVIKEYEKLNSKLIKLQDLYKTLETFPAKEEMQKIADEIRSIGNGLLEHRLSIIEEILTTNNIDYDRTWWERKTNTEDITVFLNNCAFKDTILNGKKKEMPA